MKTETTILTDDLDERITSHKPTKTSVETVSFMVDGASYEIDLGETNASKLRETVSAYIEHARRAGTAKGRQPRNPRGSGATLPRVLPVGNGSRPTYPSSDVRAWAQAQGIPVKDRGRVPTEIYDQYHASLTA